MKPCFSLSGKQVEISAGSQRLRENTTLQGHKNIFIFLPGYFVICIPYQKVFQVNNRSV